MNQPDYLDVPKEFPPDWECVSAYGQDMKGYWLELDLYNQLLCFRWIPKGKFTMGSDEKEAWRYRNENQHTVILSKGFWLAETTVTQALWQAVMGDNPSHFQKTETSDFPVETVSWEDAQDFIKQIKQDSPNLSLRLPREAEWEYACRAGTETAFNFSGKLTLDKVNYRGLWDDYEKWGKEAEKKTLEAKSYPANAWGLYEMHGNVWEWCEDSWQEHLGTVEVTDPWLNDGKKQVESEVGAKRVLRGGSWDNDGGYARSARRLRFGPDRRLNSVGLRLALGL